MTPTLFAYIAGVIVWGVLSAPSLSEALDMWETWGEDEDREKVKRRARFVLATPLWPLAGLAIGLLAVRTLIRYAQGKVPE